MTDTQGAPQAQASIGSPIEEYNWSEPITERNGSLPDIDALRVRSNDWRLDGAVQISQADGGASAQDDGADRIVIAPTAAVSICRNILLAAGFGFVGFSRHIAGAGLVDIEDGDDPAEIAEQDERVRAKVREQQALWDAAYDARLGIRKPKDPKAAERKRRQRARQKAERDAAASVPAESGTLDQNVTADRDEVSECPVDAVTLAPIRRDIETREIA